MRCEWAHSRWLCLGIPTRAVPMAKRLSVGVYGFISGAGCMSDIELSTHVTTLLLATTLAMLLFNKMIMGNAHIGHGELPRSNCNVDVGVAHLPRASSFGRPPTFSTAKAEVFLTDAKQRQHSTMN